MEIERTGEPQSFNPRVEVQLLRIVQEALANARKHSSADRVVIRIQYSPDSWDISVEDDGIGFDPGRPTRGLGPHFGLQSMRERAAAIGADFEVKSEPGHGTRVQIGGRYATREHTT